MCPAMISAGVAWKGGLVLLSLALTSRPSPFVHTQTNTGGNWKVCIVTSDFPNAGTSSQVYIILYGQQRSSAPIYLYGRDGAPFQDGHEDIFTITVGDIGMLFKIRIGHTNSGHTPSWHCKKIELQNMSSGEKFYIPVQRWLARDQEDGEICREFPILNKGQPILPVTTYEVSVATGELWNAGTAANVYISIYGSKGDTGCRQLVQSKSSFCFLRGQTDTFFLEAVHLGELCKIVIGHDGLGPGNGWFLDDIVVKDPTTNHEYAFFCHRWLDQEEDDGKIVREIYARANSIFAVRKKLEHKKKEIWAAESWKFMKGNMVQFYNKLTGGFVRLHPDGRVDAVGEKTDKYGLFDIIFNKGNICIFQSHELRHLSLALDNGVVTGMAGGGAPTELRVLYQPSGCALLESALVPGHTVIFDHSGKRINESSAGYAELSKEFVIFVKGNGDMYCHFKIKKNLENASISLESTNSPGLFVGLQPDGQTKPVIYTKDENVCFYPRVIQFGRENPMGMSATPSQGEEMTHESNNQKAIAAESETRRPLPFSVSTEIKHSQISKTLLSEENWKVLVLTGDTGTQANVTLWVYGDEGVTGPIRLKKDGPELLFLPRQKDEFQIEIRSIGEIYKIRIGHDGTSGQPEWSLQKVTLQHMKSNKILDFEANVWLSRMQVDGDIVCELPVVKGGQPVFPVVRYCVDVYTGQLKQADTECEVSLCLYGERGDSGLRLLCKSNMPVRFQKGQIDTFQIEAVSLGKLQKVLLHCEASDKSQYWYCEKVIVREPGRTSESIFICERWIPFMSQGIIYSEIELYLQEMQISHQPKIQEEANDGDWKVTVITGDLENAGTTATVFLSVYGEAKCSGPIILGSGKHQLFRPNSADIFKINLKDIGEIYKIRIGHDNTGRDPGWYLEEVRLENMATDELFCLSVDSWMAENENDGDVWKEMPIVRTNKAPLPVVVYEIYIYRGTKPGAETESNVFINLIGTKGDSGKRRLHRSRSNQASFQRGQVDIFSIKAVSLGKLEKVLINHDGKGPGNGWFLESIVIKYEEEESSQEVLFPCNRWLDEYQDDGKTERELLPESNYGVGGGSKLTTF